MTGLTVVVPTLGNRRARWISFLQSYKTAKDDFEGTSGCHAELVVALQGTSEINARAPVDQVVRLDTASTSAARNAGALRASHENLLFADDDVVLSPHCLTLAKAALTSDSAPQLAFGNVLPVGSHSWLAAPTPWGSDVRGIRGEKVCFAVTRAERKTLVAGRTLPYASLGSSNLFACRRDCILALGGFSTLLGPGGVVESAEDQDFFYRVLCNGGRAMRLPEVWGWHDAWIERDEAGQLLAKYSAGNIAVFASHALRGDAEAARITRYLVSSVLAARDLFAPLARFSPTLRWRTVMFGLTSGLRLLAGGRVQTSLVSNDGYCESKAGSF